MYKLIANICSYPEAKFYLNTERGFFQYVLCNDHKNVRTVPAIYLSNIHPIKRLRGNSL